MAFVFSVYLRGKKGIESVAEILDGHPQVINWSLEVNGLKRTLKIEVVDRASTYGIVECIRIMGYDCEQLDS